MNEMCERPFEICIQSGWFRWKSIGFDKIGRTGNHHILLSNKMFGMDNFATSKECYSSK